MITKFDINRFEIKSKKGKCSGMDDHFDICRVIEISKYDIARLTFKFLLKSILNHVNVPVNNFSVMSGHFPRLK